MCFPRRPTCYSCLTDAWLAVNCSYVGTADFWSGNLPGHVSTAASHGKLLYVEEWGVNVTFQDNFDKQAAALTGTGVPMLYWQFTTGPDGTQSCTTGCCTGYDGWEVGLTSSKGNAAAALKKIAQTAAKQDWTGLVK